MSSYLLLAFCAATNLQTELLLYYSSCQPLHMEPSTPLCLLLSSSPQDLFAEDGNRCAFRAGDAKVNLARNKDVVWGNVVLE